MNRRGRIPYIATLVVLLALLYLPFMFYTINADHDAQAMLGHIRATSGFCGWPGGFYFNSMLTGFFNVILNGLHLANNDLLASYRLVIFFSLLGIGVYTYLIMHEITGKPFLSLLVSLWTGLMPGITGLLFFLEDNIIASFAHIQFVYFYIVLVSVWRKGDPAPARRRAGILFVLSFVVALLGHRQLAVLLVTPAFLYFFLAGQDKVGRLLLVCRVYLATAALFVSVYGFLTLKWDSRFSFERLAYYLHDWLIPNSFYQQYYFFNQFGWDIKRQLLEIAQGASQLFSVEFENAGWLALSYVLAGLLVTAAAGLKSLVAPFSNRILVLFVIIHIPHSLVYESSNLERWDVLVPVLCVIGGIMCCTLIEEQGRNPDSRRRLAVICCATLAAVVLAYNIYSYRHFLVRLDRFHRRAEISDLVTRLNAGVQYGNRNRKNILLLNCRDYSDFLMPAQVNYSYRDRLFCLFPNGEIYQSTNIYKTVIRVLPEEFGKAIKDANLVFSHKDEQLVGAVLGRIAREAPGR